MSKALKSLDTMLSNVFDWIGSWFVPEQEEIEEVIHDIRDPGVKATDETNARQIVGGYKPWLHEGDIPSDLLSNPHDLTVIVRPNARKHMFNLYIWQTINNIPNIECGFRAEMSLNTRTWVSNVYGLLYLTTKRAEEFIAWEASYNERFPTSGDDLLPNLPDIAILNGTVIRHAGFNYSERLMLNEPSHDVMRHWFWIIENCSGKVFVTERAFVFEDAADAVLYKLSPIYEEK